MNPLVVLSDTGMVYRLEPHALMHIDNVLKATSEVKLSTVYDLFEFETACGVKNREIKYRKSTFHLSAMTDGNAIFWGELDGMVFNTNFDIVLDRTLTKIYPAYNSTQASTFQDIKYWDAVQFNAANLHQGISTTKLTPVLAMVVRKSSDGTKRKFIEPFFVFAIHDENNKKIGNYLPPIPNIFDSGKVCMGHGWGAYIGEDENLVQKVKDSVKWFFETAMNGDLVGSGFDRKESSSVIFNWLGDKTLHARSDFRRFLPIKVGNVFLDSLPTVTHDNEQEY